MKNLSELMKQAQELQSRMADMQAKLADIEVVGTAGGGLVNVVLNGKAEMRGVKIDPGIVDKDEVAVIEDLVAAAYNDAKRKLEERMQDEMSKLTGGMPLPPGFNLPG